jgi:hypothetical protein
VRFGERCCDVDCIGASPWGLDVFSGTVAAVVMAAAMDACGVYICRLAKHIRAMTASRVYLGDGVLIRSLAS